MLDGGREPPPAGEPEDMVGAEVGEKGCRVPKGEGVGVCPEASVSTPA